MTRSVDRAAGLVAAVSSAAWFDFFLTARFRTFSISDPDDIEIAVLLVLVGAGVTEIAWWGRRHGTELGHFLITASTSIATPSLDARRGAVLLASPRP